MNEKISEKKSGCSTLSVCVLASGSKGNSIYISDGYTAILIDAGLSGREIERRMALRNIDPESLDAILISHEHTDHVLGAGVLGRRLKVPVYMNEKTHFAAKKKLGKSVDIIYFDCGVPFQIEALNIHPFSISHDAADPSGFTIETDNKKIGVATDLGIANVLVRQRLENSNVLILESNHDPEMLQANENYSPWLKQRVKSRKGHLSNEEAGELITDLVCSRLTHIVLAHLSQENNTPEKAYEIIRPAVKGCQVKITVASQQEPDDIIVIT